MEDLPGVFHPENFGKIQCQMGEKLGAQFWGFKLPITSMLSSTRKTLDADNEKMPYQTRAFSSYSSSQWVSQLDLSPLQAPKPLGVRKPSFTCAGSPWGWLSIKPKMASLWAKLTPYCGIKISENESLRG